MGGVEMANEQAPAGRAKKELAESEVAEGGMG